MCIKDIYKEFTRLSELAKPVNLLAVRLIVAYSFYAPAMMKWADINSVAMWFGSMGIPFPTLNAYMAASTEVLGVVLLTLGFFTRAISIPLIVIMLVAIVTVHGENGFAMVQAGSELVDPWINGTQMMGTFVNLQNGYEMPLYYIIFLLVLVNMLREYLLLKQHHAFFCANSNACSKCK